MINLSSSITGNLWIDQWQLKRNSRKLISCLPAGFSSFAIIVNLLLFCFCELRPKTFSLHKWQAKIIHYKTCFFLFQTRSQFTIFDTDHTGQTSLIKKLVYLQYLKRQVKQNHPVLPVMSSRSKLMCEILYFRKIEKGLRFFI